MTSKQQKNYNKESYSKYTPNVCKIPHLFSKEYTYCR